MPGNCSGTRSFSDSSEVILAFWMNIWRNACGGMLARTARMKSASSISRRSSSVVVITPNCSLSSGSETARGRKTVLRDRRKVSSSGLKEVRSAVW
ncbi:hypothetical protein D3C80_1963010 [compost metagenome]